MEKLSFSPLIEVFREKRDWCNQVFASLSVLYPALSPERVMPLLVTEFEPLMKTLHHTKGDRAFEMFDILYETLIELEGSQCLKSSSDFYISVLGLIPQMPDEALAQPRELIIPLVSGAKTLDKRFPHARDSWISLMTKTVQKCSGRDEVLDAGRICAWVSGLAHLRERACDALQRLPSGIVETIFKTNGSDLPVGTLVADPWFKPGTSPEAKITFRYRTGGFRGLGGPFLRPPRLVFSEGRFLATDGISSCAVFADAFGVSVLPDVPVSPEDIHTRPKKQIPFRDLARTFPDIGSWHLDQHTLMFTRGSSHFIYVYGVHDG